jgi:hypothetical protein
MWCTWSKVKIWKFQFAELDAVFHKIFSCSVYVILYIFICKKYTSKCLFSTYKRKRTSILCKAHNKYIKLMITEYSYYIYFLPLADRGCILFRFCCFRSSILHSKVFSQKENLLTKKLMSVAKTKNKQNNVKCCSNHWVWPIYMFQVLA